MILAKIEGLPFDRQKSYLTKRHQERLVLFQFFEKEGELSNSVEIEVGFLNERTS